MGNHIFNVCMLFLMVKPFLNGLAHNGAGNRMGKMLLKAGHCAQYFPAFMAGSGNNVNDSGFCAGQCAGFVKYQGVGLADSFQIFPSFHGNSMFCARTHGRENGKRRCQLDCAGIIHKQDGSRPRQVL